MILFYNIWLQENEKFCIILFYIRLLYKRWNHQYQCVCSNACINCISPTTTNKTKKFLSRKMRKKYGWVYDKELKRNQQVHSKQFFYHVFFFIFSILPTPTNSTTAAMRPLQYYKYAKWRESTYHEWRQQGW